MAKALLALLACSLLGACSDMCRNQVIERLPSPDGQHDAVMFGRDCGATTGFSTQVSVVKSGNRPWGGGNVFIADGDHGKARTESWGGPWVELHWDASDRLTVRYAASSRIFQNDGKIDGVEVIFTAE